jgi:hypothetical protein
MTMEHASPSKTARCEPMAVDTLRIQGDARSCGQGPGARAHVLAEEQPPESPATGPGARAHVLVVSWPQELLSQFGLRMAGHGMSISRTHMLGNPRYALQRLVHARAG